MENGYNLNHLLQKAKSRWLMPDQLLFILQKHEPWMIQQRVHQIPASGSLFLFNKNSVSSFRRDGHNWRKKQNRNNVNEAHEKLKVGNAEALVCYYAKGADNPNFRRRIYWMLENKDIVLVHYLDITQGKTNPASSLKCSIGQSYTITQSVMHGYQSLGSPLSVEVTSREVLQERTDHFPGLFAAQNVGTSLDVERSSHQMMQELQEQLGLNCNISEQSIPFDDQRQNMDGTSVIGGESGDNCVRKLDQGFALQQRGYFGRDHGEASTDLPTWQDIALTVLQAENIEACLERTPRGTNIEDNHSMLPNPGQTQMPLGAVEQKFKISEISPQWCFANEVTKVIVIGTFCYDPSVALYAMFGDVKVQAQFMQDGVLFCQAPSNCPGKVSFCITSGNPESCSEVKEFEYRDRNSVFNNCVKLQQEEERRMEEGKLLVEFVEMLSTDSSFQELLEDKLEVWLAKRFLDAESNSSCTLAKKDRGIIHLVAGLGYDWALKTILDSGVGINFRDAKGWTALHWAARFGREEMVGALIACGASVSAVTDPTALDPMGKNAASIADAYSHKGLAAYLSASALTSRFSDLTIEKEDFRSTSDEFVASDDNQSCMNQLLEVSRKAAERTQTANRVHSFRRKQQREAANRGETEEYGLTCDETQRVSATVFPRPKSKNKNKNKNVAALTIQKYYKGWKRRTQFLTIRTKVIKIQAHVRGYRFRKYYRVIRVVSIMEKIVLRWRRKRFGLRDFRLKGEAMDEDEERDEDIFKDFRKKKLDTTVNEALERVRCLLHSREAQGQCGRMLRAFRVAKARLGVSTKALDSLNGASFGENNTADFDDLGQLPLQDRPPSPDCFKLLSELP